MDIEQHYSDHLDQSELLNQLRQRYPDGPNIYQLAPIDQLHIGGIKASDKLLQRIKQHQPQRILEIGSGMGGLMRLIRSQLTADVIGIDITHSFNTLNHALSSLNQLHDNPEIITADAQQLPFADNSFDYIIFQHSLLNIPDTLSSLQECHRVLAPQGHLLLHEVLQGKQPEQMRYPVPWARNAEQSHLLPQSKLHHLLRKAGFNIDDACNWSEEALQWRQRQSGKEQKRSPEPSLSPEQVLGAEFRRMGPNVMNNLSSEAVEVWEIMASR